MTMNHHQNPCMFFTKALEEDRLFYRKFDLIQGYFMNMIGTVYETARAYEIFYCPYCGRNLAPGAKSD